LTPEAFAAAAEIWVDRGVQIVGGCCGIGRTILGDWPSAYAAGAWGRDP